MPTPFTHLYAAQQLLQDLNLPTSTRQQLAAQRSAFLLGSIAADARADFGKGRGSTHFYEYAEPITEHPWRVMFQRYPALHSVRDDAHRAFLAGYVAHLCMDEIWTLDMLAEHFVRREWGESRQFRFFMLHVLLIYMDERDEQRLDDWQPDSLCQAVPQGWLPFMSDTALSGWRDLIYEQIKPGGSSQTLDIFGGRIGITPEQFRAVLDKPQAMQRDLWDNVPPVVLSTIETRMYEHAREQMQVYLSEA